MFSVLDPPVAPPAPHALGVLADAVSGMLAFTGDDLWQLGSADLLDATADLHRTACRLDAALHAMVREIDVRGAATAAGASSTAAWLRARLRVHPATAKRLVETSRGLLDDPAGPLVPDGDSPRAPAADSVGSVPGDRESARTSAEAEGAETAATVADVQGDSADGDSAGGEHDMCSRRGGRTGLWDAFAAGDLSAEHAQIACRTLAELEALPGGLSRTVLDEAADFLLEQGCQRDPRALGHLGRHLRHVLDPDAGESLERDEEAAQALQKLVLRDRPDGSTDISGRIGPELSAALRSHLDPLSAPRRTVDGVRDMRTLPQRQADALAELLRRYGAAAAAGPARHGPATTVSVTVSLETLEGRLGSDAAWLDQVGPASAETARRLACDARVVPVLLGTDGEPLDVGRSTYPVTQAIWRALVARDGGCVFAACDRPPEWCEAHHLTHWQAGGATSVANCALLCSHHHRSVHHRGWDLQLVGGTIWTVPPPWVDPGRTPRRNIHRDRLLRPWSSHQPAGIPPATAPDPPSTAPDPTST